MNEPKPVIFKYIRTGDISKMKPIDEKAKFDNETMITKELSLDKTEQKGINRYVLVKIAEDGKTFENESLKIY